MSAQKIPANITISTDFLREHCGGCPPVYPLVYLWVQAFCSADAPCDTAQIAKHFCITQADVFAALEHWQGAGLLRIATEGSHIFVLPAAAPDTSQPSPRPIYSTEEIAHFKSHTQDVADIFAKAETIWGKALTGPEMNTLVGFYDWLGLPADVVIFLLDYCAQKGVTKMSYAEKVALDWKENAIGSAAVAADYVHNYEQRYHTVLNNIGQPGYPTPRHRKYINCWFDEWGFSQDVVVYACEYSVEKSSGRPNMRYVNSVLKGWHEQGVTTVQQAQECAARHDEKIPASPKKRAPKTNRFINFTQSDTDYSHLREAAERIRRSD